MLAGLFSARRMGAVRQGAGGPADLTVTHFRGIVECREERARHLVLCACVVSFPGRGPTGGQAHVAQLAEHLLGKEEVSGSSPDMGSNGHRGLRPSGVSSVVRVGLSTHLVRR